MNSVARSAQTPYARFVQRLGWYARQLRGPLLVGLLILGIAALAYSLWTLRKLSQENAAVAALEAGSDVPVDPKSASGEALVARSQLLIARERFDDAQALIDASRPIASASALARMLYNQANANVRRAFAAIEGGSPDKAIPLVKLAKDAYREALRLDPSAWDAKFNYDVAMRLVRDFPGYEQEGEDVPPEEETKLWTDLPGIPKGLP